MIKDRRYQGFIYIIQNQNGLVKIGSSIFPEQRITFLENQGGFKSVNNFISGPFWGHEEIEKSLHKLFDSGRIIGEWFAIPFDDIKSVLQDDEWVSKKVAENLNKKSRPMNIKKVSLFKRENGFYAVKFNNKKTRSLKTKSKKEADQIYDELTKLLDTGKQDLTILELYNEYVLYDKSRRMLTGPTLDNLKKSVEDISEIIGDMEILYLNQDHFHRIVDSFDEKTANEYLTNLKTLFYFGEEIGIIKSIPKIETNCRPGSQNASHSVVTI